MSYSIFYDKMFIKAKENDKDVFVPMLLAGSSNCYEVGRGGKSGRRSRDWQAMTFILNGKVAGTLDEMLEKTNFERENCIKNNTEPGHEYKDDAFGWFTALAIGGKHTSNTTFRDYQNVFKSGCKNALTVEELQEFGVRVIIYSSIYDTETNNKMRELGLNSVYYTVQSSDELVTKYNEFEAYLSPVKSNLYIKITANELDMKRIKRSRKTPPIPKEYKEIEKFFVVKESNSNVFITKRLQRGYKYTFHNDYAKKFINKKIAENWAKKLAEKFSKNREFVVEEVNKKIKMYV